MILLLDTNVLIDVALDRAPFAEPAALLLDTLEKRPGTAFVAWHSISNLYYLVRPTRGGQETRDFIFDLTNFIEVAPTTTSSLRQAGRLEMGDFEDAMQVAAGMACGADMIVTRNLSDFTRSPIRAGGPEEALAGIVAL